MCKGFKDERYFDMPDSWSTLPDWLAQTNGEFSGIDVFTLSYRLLLAALAGCIIAWLYTWKRGPHHGVPSFPLTLIFLAILIAMVTQVVGNHIARAFSLVGALSIVRFRTVVDDTLDIGFVIFSVVVGMAIGAGDLAVAFVGGSIMASLIYASRAYAQWTKKPKYPTCGKLTFKTAIGDDCNQQVQKLFDTQGISYRIVAAETARGGAMMEWTYEFPNATFENGASISNTIAHLTGLQSISWKISER